MSVDDQKVVKGVKPVLIANTEFTLSTVKKINVLLTAWCNFHPHERLLVFRRGDGFELRFCAVDDVECSHSIVQEVTGAKQ